MAIPENKKSTRFDPNAFYVRSLTGPHGSEEVYNIFLAIVWYGYLVLNHGFIIYH